MNTIRLGTLVLFMFNIYFNYAEASTNSDLIKSIRGTRDHYYSGNIGSFYSNFNQPDNAITTILPLLDSDGTFKVGNAAPADDHDDDGDGNASLHTIDDGIHYFRESSNNQLKPIFSPITEGKSHMDWNNDDVVDDHMDVRGKKFISFYPLALYPKRAPSGFLGLRGKKFYYNGAKRVPSGFTGMRGKKSFYDMSNNINDNSGEFELRNDVNFDELLQKERRFLDELNEIYRMDQEMKGQPLVSDEIPLEYTEKRAPSGFLGMRGKKAADVRSTYPESKRAPSGFLGLRGKRESEDYYIESNKRSPFTSYFAMRGKNEPMVLGSDEFYSQLDRMNWPINSQRLEINRTPPKRVPNGFLGVRGKKWTDTMNDE